MQGFQEDPILVHLYGFSKVYDSLPSHLFKGRHSILRNNFHYYDKTGARHTAKAGLITDGGSIPRFFWRVVGSPLVFYLPAYLIHDEYCQRARAIPDKKKRAQLRLEADQLLDEMLEVLSCPKWKRKVIYAGVRAGARFDKGVDQSPEIGHKHRFLPYQKKFKKTHFGY